MPAQPDYGDYRDDDDYMATYGVDVSLDEAEETTVKQTKYRPDEVNRAEQEGVGISVKDGTVTLDKDGGMTVTTKNESTEKLFKRFLNKK
jgi:hypothetical protein